MWPEPRPLNDKLHGVTEEENSNLRASDQSLHIIEEELKLIKYPPTPDIKAHMYKWDVTDGCLDWKTRLFLDIILALWNFGFCSEEC